MTGLFLCFIKPSFTASMCVALSIYQVHRNTETLNLCWLEYIELHLALHLCWLEYIKLHLTYSWWTNLRILPILPFKDWRKCSQKHFWATHSYVSASLVTHLISCIETFIIFIFGVHILLCVPCVGILIMCTLKKVSCIHSMNSRISNKYWIIVIHSACFAVL